jgi:hypothetical protein
MLSVAQSRCAAVVLAIAACLSLSPVAAQTAPTQSARCGPALDQHLQLDVSNPAPGSTLFPGDVVISGLAFDRLAQSGTGIDRVSVFLNPRDEGGTHLADAVLNEANPLRPESRFAAAGYSATITLPSNTTGAQSLDIRAHSAITNQEMVVTVPFVLNDESESDMSCTATLEGAAQLPETAGVTATPPAAAPVPTTPAPTTTNGATEQPPLRLELVTPMAGALVAAGDYDVRVMASDPSASEGTGIDQISVFLGDQDAGGLILGTIMVDPSATGRELPVRVDVPERQGGHNLVVYARTPNGRVGVLRVPIIITR